MGKELNDKEIEELYELFKEALALASLVFPSPPRLPRAEQPVTKKVSTVEEILDSVKRSFKDEIQGYLDYHRIFAETAAQMTKEKPSDDYDYYAAELKHKILSDIYESLLKRL
jgi:hypothetical protein